MKIDFLYYTGTIAILLSFTVIGNTLEWLALINIGTLYMIVYWLMYPKAKRLGDLKFEIENKRLDLINLKLDNLWELYLKKGGYNKAIEEFKNILQKEIDNEKDAIDRKAKRNWSILNELIYVKDMLLKEKKNE
jgi:hypothetical protein